jgi:hypothetical protein
VPQGAHAFLGASKYSWLNYDEDKLIAVYRNQLAAQRGTRLHEFAKDCIELGQKLPKSKKTLNSFVNDAIGFKMEAEQPLFYSENCFGTADAISFKNNFLRIHDLKTGVTPAHMDQLEIYMALFCLEYNYKPASIGSELRIYQNDDILIGSPDPERIEMIIGKIINFDEIIAKIKLGEI